MTFIPYPYERLKAARGGAAVDAEQYGLLFRALQYNSYPLYDVMRAGAPELLTAASDTRVAFVVDKEGHPTGVTLTPGPARGGEAINETLAGMVLPRELVGARVEFLIGNPNP